MNALFGALSKLSFAFLAIQHANCALGQDCADDSHWAGLGGRGWCWGAFWSGHVGSYRPDWVFFSGGGAFAHKRALLSCFSGDLMAHYGDRAASCARLGRAQDN
jgi:hypothetical protein